MKPSVLTTELHNEIFLVKPSPSQIEITGITSNSMHVKNGFLFIAEKGLSTDGHKYIPSAIERGAMALLVEKVECVPHNYPGLVLKSTNTRAVAPAIGALFYNKPSDKLFCIGITGTNGKTSFTYLVEHFFNAAKKKTGVIGTIDHHIGSKIWNSERTTPHPIEIQERLKDFVENNAKTLAIEVTSHALDQKRVEGIEFDVGVFSNLTRDHLDYHSTMEEYFEVKQKFFTENLSHSSKKQIYAIINRDDPWGAKIQIPSNITKWTYGAGKINNSLENDFSFILNKMDFSGTLFTLNTPFGTMNLNSPLIGNYNIYNVLSSIAAALAGGLDLKLIEKSLPQFPGIPGRLQRVQSNQKKSVFIDYAHTPDALENVLSSILKIKEQFKSNGRILCVFGCGGDRDKGKRPIMAQIAERYADLIIVTSDNPRSENPIQIINDINTGFNNPTSHKIILEPDRHKAITLSINEAMPDDIVLIAGKGHEDYQIIGKEKFYFSDYEIARKLLT